MNFVEVIGNYDKQRKGRGRILIFAVLIFAILAIYLLNSFVYGFSEALEPSQELIVASPQSNPTEIIETVPSADIQATQRAAMSQAIRGSR
jgi:hypothetical protein